ncbi:MAG TPA: hypothetical protein PK514_07660 [Spirochaetota bacterium]|nr:hypothetical protein [Spirochaetota bacterium]
MNQSKKRAGALLIVLILLMTGGFVLYKHVNKTDIVNGNPTSEIKKVEEKVQPGSPVEKEKTAANSNAIKFKTTDDIKVRYGKIEEVYLYNGKKYKGAVLTTDEFYTIVTVNGTFKIPMNEVKLRNIIR